MTQRATSVLCLFLKHTQIIYFTCYEMNVFMWVDFSVLLLELFPWLAWVQEGEKLEIWCNFSIKFFNPLVGHQEESEVKEGKMCLLCLFFYFRLLNCMPNVGFYLIYVKSIKFWWQYSTPFCFNLGSRYSLWSLESTCSIHLLPMPKVNMRVMHYFKLT